MVRYWLVIFLAALHLSRTELLGAMASAPPQIRLMAAVVAAVAKHHYLAMLEQAEQAPFMAAAAGAAALLLILLETLEPVALELLVFVLSSHGKSSK
jgi:hypothetical protein